MIKMKIKGHEIDFKELGKSLICIGAGTGLGLIVYGIFLYYNIAIVGWNLGLIFAPLVAGYVETVLANRILGKNLGAISAFILFIDTTYYSFILKNPTLGANLITAGSIVVILQAAFPTLINYILIVILGGILSNFKWVFTRIGKAIKNNVRWQTPDPKKNNEAEPYFDENKSNEKINALNFFFITSTDMPSKSHKIIGIYHSEVFIENETTLGVEHKKVEKKLLVNIKEGKDKCLTELCNTIKKHGGNGVLDLNIKYELIGLNGDHIHINATGIGILVI